MSGQGEIENILYDLNSYFGDAGIVSSGEPNPEIARMIVERWGIRGVMMGFAWAVEDIRKFSQSTLGSIRAEEWTDRMIASKAMGLMGYLFDLVQAVGNDASAWLADIIMTATNEDVRALAAYTFATDQFIDPRFQNVLLETYNNTEGTSCRLALALALYMCGNRKYLKHLKHYISKGLFCSLEYYDEQERYLKQSLPDLSRSEREKMTVLMVIVPETMGVPSEHSGLMEILSLDIGSNGLVYRKRPGLDWKRK